ncbi:MAG TPA: zf-HC2 domain-containing protein, partial [Bacteroidia bacterium]|nr:zf-HC2 domain-containing protein [Bacteroidia bacterium]
MSNHLKHKIYSPGDCLSEKMLFDYIDNKLSQKERHVVEKHLLDCEMCSDALEGLEMVTDRNRISVIKDAINKKVTLLDSARSDKKEAVVVSFNYKMAFSIAATIALLIVGVFFFNKINLKEATMSGDMAELKETESPPPPPAPPLNEAEKNVAETKDEAGAVTGVKGEENKLTPNKILDQEIAFAEEQKPGFYKGKEGAAENRNQETPPPVEASGNGAVIAFDATVNPKDDKLNNQLETVSIPKTSAPEREKDAKLDDTKKAEEKTVAGA